MTIRKALSSLMLGLTAVSPAAVASSFIMEGGVSYSDIDFDTAGSDSALGLDFTYHFAPVDTRGLPLAEAPFLRRSSNLFVGFSTTDESDVDTFSAQIEGYSGQLYGRVNFDRPDDGTDTSNDYGLRVGFLPMDGLRLAAGLDKDDAADVDTIALEAKYVSQQAGGTALNIEGGIDLVDDAADTKILSLLLDYYFNPMLSVGPRLVYVDNDFGSDEAFGLGGQYFFSQTAFAALEYLTSDAVDVIGLRVGVRF